MPWPSSAWFKPASSPSRGWPSCASGNGTGRARIRSAPWRQYLGITAEVQGSRLVGSGNCSPQARSPANRLGDLYRLRTLPSFGPGTTMIERRPFCELPRHDLEWLRARHHPAGAGGENMVERMWGCLKGLNDEEIAPNTGFAMQAHANVEIVTYVG